MTIIPDSFALHTDPETGTVVAWEGYGSQIQITVLQEGSN